MADHGLAIAGNKIISTVKADLETRIADAFTAPLSSAELSQLLAEVAQADRDAQAASARANEIALDPATRPDAVAKARRQMEDADFSRRRMEKATEGLDGLRKQAIKREQDAATAAEFEAARAERDQLVEDLKEYPELVSKILSLIERLQESDKRIQRANISGGGKEDWLFSAEHIACGRPEAWRADGTSDQPRLTSSTLVILTPKGGRWAWPKRSWM